MSCTGWLLPCLYVHGGTIQFNLELYEPEQEIALNRRLRAMERDGQLHCDRRGAYGIVNKLDLVAGTVLGVLVPDSHWILTSG